MSWPQKPPPLPEWLAYLGHPECSCEYAWKGLGVLYGVNMGKAWIRMTTAADCPEHRE